ncbi:MAG: hypothetical protein IK990_05680 [Ruminiclostridium sp.]|nr:hypothetical protein [Ruminiclostridium sp.]
MNMNEMINKLLDSAENGAELHFVNIKISPGTSGTCHKGKTQCKRRQSEKKARRQKRKK